MPRRLARPAMLAAALALGATLAAAPSALAQQKRVYIAPDDHTDYWWTASETDYRSAFLTTLDYYLNLADATAANPADFQSRWNCDGWLWVYEYQRNKTPAEFGRLLSRIRSGHITVPLNAYAICFGAQPAEAVLRGMYYPGRLARDHNLSFELAIAMEDQTFPLGLPSLWAGSGAKYSWKGVCGCVTQVPGLTARDHEICRAQGPDGSGVLLKWYSLFNGDNQSLGGYAEARFPNAVVDVVTTNAPFNGFAARYPYNVIGAFGKGWDDFQTQTDEFITTAINKSNTSRRVIVSNEIDFFRDFEQTYGQGSLPIQSVTYGNEWETDAASLAEFHARAKRALEKLRAAEALATLVSLRQPSFMTPRAAARDTAFANLGLFWEHNFGMYAPQTGAAGVAGRLVWLERITAEIESYSNTLHSDAAAALATMIRAGSSNPRFFAFNPLSFVRTDVADVPYSGPLPVSVFNLATNTEVPSQIITIDSVQYLRVLAENIPSVGYLVFEIRPSTGQSFSPAASVSNGSASLITRTYTITADNRAAQSVAAPPGPDVVRVSGYAGAADPYVYFGSDSDQQTAGVQFAIDLPTDAVVSSAELILNGSPGFSASPTGSVSIHLYDVDSCPPFVNGPSGDLLTFQPTWSTTIPWALPSWSAGAPNVSPNLAPFVQRFISRPAYAPGNFLGLAITEGSIAPNHYYGFDDFIKPAGTPAQLRVTFSSASLGGSSSSARVVDNGRYAVEFNPSGAISSVLDRSRANRQFIQPQLGRFANDLGGSLTSGAITIENSGPVSVTLRADSSTPVAHTTRLTLYRPGSPLESRIDVSNRITQNFDSTQTFAFGFNLPQPFTRHEEVGAIARARLTTDTPPGDYAPRLARYDWLTFNHFADMTSTQDSVGITLAAADASFFQLGSSSPTTLDTTTPSITAVAGGKLGSSQIDNQGAVSTFTQRYALTTHDAYDQPAAMRFALAQQNPLVCRITSAAADIYPSPSFSLLNISSSDVLLWALKPADDGIRSGLGRSPGRGGVIARLWNLADAPRTPTLSSPAFPIRAAAATTHLETDTAALAPAVGSLDLPMLRQQLRTVRLTITCPADFNYSGSATVQDIFDFLASWFAQSPDADINQTSGITVQDIFDFLAAWFQGCA